MVRERSAKPLYSGSNPLAASRKSKGSAILSLTPFSLIELLVAPGLRLVVALRISLEAGWTEVKSGSVNRKATEVGALRAKEVVVLSRP